MANTIQIIIEAVDKTGGIFNDVMSSLGISDKNIKKINEKLPAIVAGFTLAGTAIGLAVEYTKDAIEETSNYNDQIKELARITGQSLEDTSRLIQVAQDMGVEYKDLVSGLGNATKNGVDVSIESLLDLADEYKELHSPIDRAKWLTEHFGSAGRDLEPIFESARESIVEDMAQVDEALVWDEEKQAAIDNYEQGMADVKKSFEDLKIEVTMNALPAIQSVLDVMTNEEGRGGGYKRMLDDTKSSAWKLTEALKELWEWMMTIATGPNGGTFTSAAAAGFGGTGSGYNWYGSSGTQNSERERAWGGWESANTPYLVGERGPEIFVPGTGGKIIPNNQLGGGGGIDIDGLARAIGREVVEGMIQSGYVR